MHNGFAFYQGDLRSVSLHRHHAVELVISEGPCEFWNESEPLKQGRVMLLGADIPHRFVGSGLQWFIYVEPESELGLKLTQYLNGQPAVSFPDTLADKLPIAEATSVNELIHLFQQFTGFLLLEKPTPETRSVDNRISSLIDYIKCNIDGPLTLRKLMGVACLSEGRLIHLFKEQVGIPIRRYILWTRLQVSVQRVLQGETLTRAAHSGGFADSAHFSRTFSEMFGIRPSDVLLK